MTLTGLVKDGVLRLVLDPANEEPGWTEVALPAGAPPELLRWDGEQVVVDTGPLFEGLIAKIDTEAETQRQRFITPGAGQAMEYQEALEQARAYKNGDPGLFPMLAADVAAGTIDPQTQQAVVDIEQAANLVLWMFGQFGVVGAMIREARLGAKAAVRAALAAGDIAAAKAAADIDWAALLP